MLEKVYQAALTDDDATVLANLDRATAAAANQLQARLNQTGKKGTSPAMMFNISWATIGEETTDGETATVVFVYPESLPNAKPRPVQLVVEDGAWKVSPPEFVQQTSPRWADAPAEIRKSGMDHLWLKEAPNRTPPIPSPPTEAPFRSSEGRIADADENQRIALP